MWRYNRCFSFTSNIGCKFFNPSNLFPIIFLKRFYGFQSLICLGHVKCFGEEIQAILTFLNRRVFFFVIGKKSSYRMFLCQKLGPRDMIVSLVATQKMFSNFMIFIPGSAEGKKYVVARFQWGTWVGNIHNLVNQGPSIFYRHIFNLFQVVLIE